MDHAICQWPSSTANVRCCGDLVEDSVSGFDVFVFFSSRVVQGSLERGGGEYEYTTIRRSYRRVRKIRERERKVAGDVRINNITSKT